MVAEDDFQQRMRRIEGLIRQIETAPDTKTRACAVELTQSLMSLHGAAFDRLLEIVAQSGEPGLAIIDDLGRDELVASLLLLYGLHPVDLETRVRQALDEARPYLHSHGGSVELLSLDDGVVRLRLQGNCHGCPSSAETLKQTIEQAIYLAAPDVASLEVEGLAAQAAANGFVQLEKFPGKG
jgi:Fe-S cluster biogenesis protein NfuA